MTDKAPERIFLPPADQVPFEDWNLLSEKLDGYDTEYVRADLAPKVKQLEWVIYCHNSLNSSAATPFGEYICERQGENGWFGVWHHGQSPDDEPISEHERLGEARAAAQADFERRVRECLV